MCFNSSCDHYRKSIRRDLIEGEFEQVLQTVQPSQTFLDLAKDMFTAAWQMQAEHSSSVKAAIQKELKAIENKSATLLERIVTASNATVVTAYEKQIDALAKDKLVMAEKLKTIGQPARPFG